MKKNILIILLNIVFFLLCQIHGYAAEIAMSPAQMSEVLEQSLREAFRDYDYKKAAEILNQQIMLFREETERDLPRLYHMHNQLAYIYAWKLNEPDKALEEYRKVLEAKKRQDVIKNAMPVELVYMGEIYEMKKAYPKALESYKTFLDELIAYQKIGNDKELLLTTDELINIVKYRIDGLNTAVSDGDFIPLMKKIKPVRHPYHFAFIQILTFMFAPIDVFEYDTMKPGFDVIQVIKKSPHSINSEIFTYMLVLSLSAGEVNEASEKAMEAYLQKYPEGYFSILLRYMFFKYYKENNQEKKAEKLLKEIKQIGMKKNIEIVTEPDRRFEKPEKTWETFKKALLTGDSETLAECHIMSAGSIGKVFSEAGVETMKEFGRKMGDIEKIEGDTNSATYRAIFKEYIEGKEQEIAEYIHFYNIDGEWKLGEF